MVYLKGQAWGFSISCNQRMLTSKQSAGSEPRPGSWKMGPPGRWRPGRQASGDGPGPQTPPSPSHDPTGGGTVRPTRPAATHDGAGAGSTCAPVPVRAALALPGPDFQMRRDLLISSSCVSSLTVEKGCSPLRVARKRGPTYKNPSCVWSEGGDSGQFLQQQCAGAPQSRSRVISRLLR